MSDNYANAAEEVKGFFVRVSAECDTIASQVNGYSERMGRITQSGNPAEFDSIVKGIADDLELFSHRLNELLPDYRRNLELLTEGFVERNKSLDAATDAGAQELEGMRREAQKLTETAARVKPKVTTLRDVLVVMRDANRDHRLTASAQRVITTANALFAAFEDLETFALKVSFSVDQK